MKRNTKTGGESTAQTAYTSNVRVLHQVKDEARHKSGEVHQLSADQVQFARIVFCNIYMNYLPTDNKTDLPPITPYTQPQGVKSYTSVILGFQVRFLFESWI